MRTLAGYKTLRKPVFPFAYKCKQIGDTAFEGGGSKPATRSSFSSGAFPFLSNLTKVIPGGQLGTLVSILIHKGMGMGNGEL